MRRRIVAGNWKMNLLNEDATKLYHDILRGSEDLENVEVLVFPPAIYVQGLLDIKGEIPVGVQNFYPKEKGAYTGEISVTQIKDCGVSFALIGHSERRMHFNESAELLKEKVNAAIQYGICPVFCCGEPLEVRERNDQNDYVLNQLQSSLFHLSQEDIRKCVIAYEPVWAIGTGVTASSAQAEEMHASIRSWLKSKYGQETADNISILYGGSCNASNASELFACPNVDGGLIGGASLDASSFLTIAKSF